MVEVEYDHAQPLSRGVGPRAARLGLEHVPAPFGIGSGVVGIQAGGVGPRFAGRRRAGRGGSGPRRGGRQPAGRPPGAGRRPELVPHGLCPVPPQGAEDPARRAEQPELAHHAPAGACQAGHAPDRLCGRAQHRAEPAAPAVPRGLAQGVEAGGQGVPLAPCLFLRPCQGRDPRLGLLAVAHQFRETLPLVRDQERIVPQRQGTVQNVGRAGAGRPRPSGDRVLQADFPLDARLDPLPRHRRVCRLAGGHEQIRRGRDLPVGAASDPGQRLHHVEQGADDHPAPCDIVVQAPLLVEGVQRAVAVREDVLGDQVPQGARQRVVGPPQHARTAQGRRLLDEQVAVLAEERRELLRAPAVAREDLGERVGERTSLQIVRRARQLPADSVLRQRRHGCRAKRGGGDRHPAARGVDGEDRLLAERGRAPRRVVPGQRRRRSGRRRLGGGPDQERIGQIQGEPVGRQRRPDAFRREGQRAGELRVARHGLAQQRRHVEGRRREARFGDDADRQLVVGKGRQERVVREARLPEQGGQLRPAEGAGLAGPVAPLDAVHGRAQVVLRGACEIFQAQLVLDGEDQRAVRLQQRAHLAEHREDGGGAGGERRRVLQDADQRHDVERPRSAEAFELLRDDRDVRQVAAARAGDRGAPEAAFQGQHPGARLAEEAR